MASIPEQFIASVFELLDEGIAKVVSRREVEAHASPPRVVAIPLGSQVIDVADRPGDKKYEDKGRPLYVRRFAIEWWCHGAPTQDEIVNFEAAENLFVEVLLAIRNRAHHSVVFSGERWIDQEEGGDGFMKQGTQIVFTSTIDFPIRARRGGVVTLTETPPIDTTYKLNDEEL